MHPSQTTSLSAEMLALISKRSEMLRSHCSPADDAHHMAVPLAKLQEELLSSEVEYLKQLEKVQTFFMEPLASNHILDREQFDSIFGQLKTIYLINGELVRELRANVNNILSAFNTMAPYFKLYSAYAAKYRCGLATLNEAIRCNKDFAKFVENQECRPEVQCKLSSLLIVPIQRIPRYVLIIQQLLDRSSVTADHYRVLLGAHQKMVDSAKHLDAMVEEQENFERLSELSMAVKDGKALVIKPGRKLVKHGVLLASDKHKLQEKYVILFTDILMLCHMKRKCDVLQHAGSLRCELILPLHKCSITSNAEEVLVVSCEDHTLFLESSSKCEKFEWLERIKEAIHSEHGNRLTLKKRHSSRRPASGCDLESYRDYGVSPGQKLRKRRSLQIADEIQPESSKRRRSLLVPETDQSHKFAGKGNTMDCLFPLRERATHANACNMEQTEGKNIQQAQHRRDFQPSLLTSRRCIHSTVETPATDELMELCVNSATNPMDVYVFGNPTNSYCFSFGKLCTAVATAAKNVKKLFRFR